MNSKINTYTKKKLTEKESIKLFKQVAVAQEAKRILEESNQISKEYSDELKIRIVAGISARDKLFEANIGLVSSRVTKFLPSAHHLTYDDLFQEASEGLIIAIERFEVDKNNKLSTYAMIWIDRYMLNAIKNLDRCIRYPKHVEEKLSKINNAESILLQKGISNPSFKEISKVCGIPADEVKKIILNKSDVLSLNTKVSDKDDTTFEDMVSDSEKTALEKRLSKELNKTLLLVVNTALSARDSLILKMKYGLEGYRDDFTLDEIGKKVGLSKEAVRQSVARSLNVLRGNKELLAACF